ncbi:MAG: GTP-binding protein [Bryobacteraceae bacterium]
MKPVIALIGGFLGAGKTTLILAAAALLQRRGVHVAVVLNDQGDDLVDTQFARSLGLSVDQVAGGCFCCRFPDLIESLDRLASAEIIFAEAVGSCTDIVATTLRPLLRDYPDRFRVAPLTVVLHSAAPFASPDLEFLNANQQAEADVLVGWAADLPAGARRVNAVTGEGVAEWLDEILSGDLQVAERPLTLDYARYAEAEASLAWLNTRVTAAAVPAISPAMLVGPLLDRLSAAVPGIVHLKLLVQCEAGYLKAALTASGSEPAVEGTLDASPCRVHEILLNVRALTGPEELQNAVEREFAALPARLTWRNLRSFRPAAPVPWHKTV